MNLPPGPISPEAMLQRHLQARGLKQTRQRSLIVHSFLAAGGHLDVDQLLARVRQSDPKVSAATVYRTMKLLAEVGIAHAQRFGDGHTRYESAVDRHHHDHLICQSCGTIVEFENDRIESLQDAVAKKHGFQVLHHKLELYGLCGACAVPRGAG